jgi:hypothetical protein
MTQTATNQTLPNRWLLAGGGFLMQLALGAVYAWSVFRDPLIKSYGWSISEFLLQGQPVLSPAFSARFRDTRRSLFHHLELLL